MDYPRYPISELHLGEFPDSLEFQSWKVNFKTEVCANSVFPQITLHWIKEVEMAKPIGELMTSRSIVGRTDFPDFDMLDAKIAEKDSHECALPKESKCRRATCSKNTTDS